MGVKIGNGYTTTADYHYSNIIDLPRPYRDIKVGYKFESIVSPTSFEVQLGDGGSQAVKKRIAQVVISLFKSLGCDILDNEGVLMDIPFRQYSSGVELIEDLFTGYKKVKFRHGFDCFNELTVKQSKPYPMTLLMIQVWHNALN